MYSVRIVGPGRAGTSLAIALADRGWTVRAPMRHGDDLTQAAADVDVVVLSVPDDAIADCARAIAPSNHAVICHLAGSLGTGALLPHGRRGALHPLVALPTPDIGARRLVGGIPFAISGDPMMTLMVEALGGRPIALPDADRPAYHAAACVASNHLVGLMGQVERITRDLGIDFEAFVDLARATLDNVAAVGPEAALTGPAARGDVATIERHRAALGADEAAIYDSGLALVRAMTEPSTARTATQAPDTPTPTAVVR